MKNLHPDIVGCGGACSKILDLRHLSDSRSIPAYLLSEFLEQN